jgi:ribose transport system permease protein
VLKKVWLWPFIGAVALCVAIGLITSSVWNILMTALAFSSFYVLTGIGQMFVISSGPGNIDLSVPSTITLSALVSMSVMNRMPLGILVGIIVAILLGVSIGIVNYSIVWLGSIPPLIATLATNYVFLSIAISFSKGFFVKPPVALQAFVNVHIFSIPILMIIALCLAVLLGFLLKYAPYGRAVMAVGQNERASWLSGIGQTRTRYLTYILCSALASITGVLLAAFSGGASADMGNEYLFASIAVVVLGGTTITGGAGNVQGIIGAGVLLLLIGDLLNIAQLSAGPHDVVTGVIIVLVIFLAKIRVQAP